MVRPSNSFLLQKNEMKEIIVYIKYLNKLKEQYPLLNGIVLGYYTKDKKLDEKFLQEVNKVNKNLKITFHKAIDELVKNKEYLKLKGYNIITVLIQGGTENIINNIEQIKEIKKNLPNIEILLGGGISDKNIKELIELNCSIHLGSLAKIDKNYNKGYNIVYLNKIKQDMLGAYERLHIK